MAQLDELLIYLKEHDCSDLHMATGLQPRVRIKGQIRVIEGEDVLTDEGLRELLKEIASPRNWQEYIETQDVDFAYGLEGVARYRANYFVQQNGAGAVFRIIPEEIISIEKLKLKQSIEDLAELESGLVLVTGPTGSGKSTTLAAIIDKINKTTSKHIVTIEDPVEFVHQNRGCIFSHREVGLHTQGFGPAKCGSERPSRWPLPRQKWECWSSRPSTPTMQPKRLIASSTPFPQKSRTW